jgi:hypothetical protein
MLTKWEVERNTTVIINHALELLYPEVPDTAAEAMNREMPSRFQSTNWAAGPTLSELFKADEEREGARLEDEYWDRRDFSPG